MTYRHSLAGIAVALLFGSATPAPARTTYLWNVANGSFQNATSWTPAGGPPGAADVAQFSSATTFQSTIDSDWTTAGLVILLGTTTLDMNGHTLTTGSLSLGSSTNGSSGNTTLSLVHGTLTLNGSMAIPIGNISTLTWTIDAATYRATGSTDLSTNGGGVVNVTVRNGGIYSVGQSSTIGSAATAQATFTVDGVGSTASFANGAIFGGSGLGNVNIQNGGLLQTKNSVILANAVNSSTTTQVTGVGSTWNQTDGMITTGQGNATLSVLNGGTLNVTGASTASGITVNDHGFLNVVGGTVTVTGPNSGITVNGTSSAGTFYLTNGATVTTPNLTRSGLGSLGFIGAAPTLTVNGGILSYGNATLDLSSSTGAGVVQLQNGATTTGITGVTVNTTAIGLGPAKLNILNGSAILATQQVIVGTASGSGAMLIDGAGSRLQVNFSGPALPLTIGGTAGGVGTLTLQNGGFMLVNPSIVLGQASGATGTLIVTGAGSKINSVNMSVGVGGAGTLTIAAGGVVNSAQVTIAELNTSFSSANVSGAGSTWTAGGLYAGGTNAAAGGNGLLAIAAGGAVIVTGDTKVWGTGGVSLTGGSLTTGSFTRLGSLNFQTGALTIDGTLGTGLFTNGSAPGNLVIQGAANTDLPTLQLINGAVASNITTLSVGDNRPGVVMLTNGSQLTATSVTLATTITGNGTISLTGAGTALTATGAITVGGPTAGASVLNIGVGSAVTAGTALTLNPAGTINLTGGTLTTASFSANGGVFNWASGTMAYSGTATVDAPQLSALLGVSGTLTAGRTLQGANLTLADNLTVNGGSVAAGNLTNSAVLSLSAGTAQATTTFTNNSSGLVVIQNSATLRGPTTNLGEIQFAGAAGTLSGGTLTNAGRLDGTGRITANLTNNANGVISEDAGQRLVFSGATNINNLNGTMSLTGGTIEFTGTLTNAAGGFISGRGTFRGSSANTSGVGLINNGVVAFSGGTSDIFGKVQLPFLGVSSPGTGQIITAGAGILTFHDDVVHNGAEIRTVAGSRTVFFGAESGAGPFTGTGPVEMDGDLRPGNSPASVSYAGDLILGNSANLHAEIGGTTLGSQYDHLQVAGNVSFAGNLDAQLLTGFVPVLGQRFDIVAFGTRQGSFSSYTGLSLGANLQFTAGFDSNHFYLAVTPPASPGLSTWTGTTSGLWNDPSNWAPTGVPASSPNTQIVFGVTPNAVMTNDIPGTLILNQLTFYSVAPVYSLVGNGLDFRGNAAAQPQIVLNSLNGVTIGTPITLTNNLSVSGIGTLALNGEISGAGSLTFAGGATLTLGNGANSFTGGTVVANGTVLTTAAGALPAGQSVSVIAGTLDLGGTSQSIGALTLSDISLGTASPRPVVRGGNSAGLILGGDITYTPAPGVSPSALIGSVLNLGGATRTINVTASGSDPYDVVITNHITGTGGLITAGPGRIVLTSTSSYSGATTITGGPLFLATVNALPATSPVILAAGTILNASPASGTAEVVPGNYNQTLGSLTGPTTATVTLLAGTLTLGSDNTNAAFSGTLNIPGDALVKIGFGTQTLSGLNSQTTTTVNGGTLAVTTDTALGQAGSPVAVNAFGTLTYSASATTTSRAFTLNGGTMTATAGQTATLSNDTIAGGFIAGPGAFIVTGGTALSAGTTTNSATITQTGPAAFANFSNGGALTVAAGHAVPGNFTRFTNQGSGTITVAAASVVNANDFQSYGVLTLAPAVVGGGQFTEFVNTGTSPLFFNGGSLTFIGTAATAGPPSNPNFVAGIDLHGQNAVVKGGLFVNNGFVADSGALGTATVIADFGSLVKGAGFFQNPVVTQNGGRFQAGNSPGAAAFGRFVFGPGGVDNYVFAIDDATGTAGPSPDALGHVIGWGLVKAVQRSSSFSLSSPGDFTWTATPEAKLTVAIDTLINPTTVGADIAGPMADFDPTRAYSWLAIQWAGTYSGPTDAATLNADTAFDTGGFVNPFAGTFGWALSDSSLSLSYTPTPVPEPGTLSCLVAAAVGLAWRRRRVRASRRPLALFTAVVYISAAAAPAHAATYTWTGAGIGVPPFDGVNWSAPANWQGSLIPAGSPNTTIAFAAAPSGLAMNNLASPFVLTELDFNTGITLTGAPLSFQGVGGSGIGLTSPAAVVIANNLAANTPYLNLASYASGTLTLAGAISGSGSLFISENYILVLANGGNTYAGDTNVFGSTLTLGANGAAIPANGNVFVSQGGTLNLNGYGNQANTAMRNLTLYSSTLRGPSGGGDFYLNSLVTNDSGGKVDFTGATNVGLHFVNSAPYISLAGPNTWTGGGTSHIQNDTAASLELVLYNNATLTNSIILANGTAGKGFWLIGEANTNTIGTMVLTNTTNTANLTVDSAAYLQVAAVAALGTGSLTLQNTANDPRPGTLQYTGGTIGMSKPITLGSGGGQLYVQSPGTNLTLSGVIGESTPGQPLLVSGYGNYTNPSAVTLTGTNTFTGRLTIAFGATVSVASIPNGGVAGPIGAASNAPANLQIGDPNLGGGTLQYTGPSATTDRGLTLVPFRDSSFTNVNAIEVTTAATTLTVAGQVTGTGGLTKAGPGSLTLANIGNTYSGGTTITNGTLRVSDLAALGSGPLAVGNPSLFRSVLQYDGPTATFAKPITLLSVGGSNNNGDFFVSPLGTNLILNGVINEAGGSAGLVVVGPGAVTLTGANTFSSGVNIFSGGIVSVPTLSNGGVASPLGASARIIIGDAASGDGTFRYTGPTFALTNIIHMDGSNSTIEVTTATTNLSLNGLLIFYSPTAGLTKTGLGMLTLATPIVSSGDMFVTGGILAIGLAGAAIPSGINVTASPGAALQIAFTSGSNSAAPLGTLTLNGGALRMPAGNPTYYLNQLVTVGGTVDLTGSIGAVDFIGAGAAVNVTGNSSWVGGNSSAVVNAEPSANTPGNEVPITIAPGVILKSGIDVANQFRVAGGGTLYMTGPGTYFSILTVNLAKLRLDAFTPITNTVLTLDGGTLQYTGPTNTLGNTNQSTPPAAPAAFTVGPGGGTIEVSNAATVLTLVGNIAGSGGLTKTGPGVLVLNNPANTYYGGLTISGGRVDVAADALLGVANPTVNPAGTLRFTASDTSGRIFNLNGGTLQAPAGVTLTLTGAAVNGGFLAGPGGFTATGGAALSGSTSFASTPINVTGAATFTNFTNGGPLTISAGPANLATLSRFTNQGSAAITITAASVASVADFQSYGTLTLNPATVGSGTFTELVNTGTAPLNFNGGSRTFIGTAATAGPPTNPNFVAGIDLNGKNAVVAGGLFVNNGFVADGSAAGTATIVADFGSLVKGAGFFQNPVQTINGGRFQAGNSPGAAAFGHFVFGPGGVDNYVFAIDDATGAAGPSPDALGHVIGWGLVRAVQRSSSFSLSSPGDFTWTATPEAKLTVAIDTLINPTTVGADIAGPMADFDPTQSYVWPAVKWSGAYSGPTDAATLNADTAFDTGGFVNPFAGTFGWALSDSSLSLSYSPTPVPEPGTLILTATAFGLGWLGCRRRIGAVT